MPSFHDIIGTDHELSSQRAREIVLKLKDRINDNNNEQADTILHWAVYRKITNLVLAILESPFLDASIFTKKNAYERSALQIAVNRHSHKLFSVMLKKQKQLDKNNEFALQTHQLITHLLIHHSKLVLNEDDLNTENSLECARALLEEYPACLSYCDPITGLPRLHYAFIILRKMQQENITPQQKRNYLDLIRLMISTATSEEINTSPFINNEWVASNLMGGVIIQDISVTQLLLASPHIGPSLISVWSKKRPLDFAANNGTFIIVKALIKRQKELGIGYEVETHENYTPLLAAVRRYMKILTGELAIEDRKGYANKEEGLEDFLKIINLLLKEYPEFINTQETGKNTTPIYYAILGMSHKDATVKAAATALTLKLLTFGAMVDGIFVGRFGTTPRLLARMNKVEGALDSLLEKVEQGYEIDSDEMETNSPIIETILDAPQLQTKVQNHDSSHAQTLSRQSTVLPSYNKSKTTVKSCKPSEVPKLSHTQVSNSFLALSQNHSDEVVTPKSSHSTKQRNKKREPTNEIKLTNAIDIIYTVIDAVLEGRNASNRLLFINTIETQYGSHQVSQTQIAQLTEVLQKNIKLEPHAGLSRFFRCTHGMLVLNNEEQIYELLTNDDKPTHKNSQPRFSISTV
jgi:hypothetical protein